MPRALACFSQPVGSRGWWGLPVPQRAPGPGEAEAGAPSLLSVDGAHVSWGWTRGRDPPLSVGGAGKSPTESQLPEKPEQNNGCSTVAPGWFSRWGVRPRLRS